MDGAVSGMEKTAESIEEQYKTKKNKKTPESFQVVECMYLEAHTYESARVTYTGFESLLLPQT